MYCDLDGCLVDFDKAAEEFLGVKREVYWSWPDDKFWSSIRRKPNWFNDLPPMQDYQELWGYIRQFKPTILTALGKVDVERSDQDKRAWVAKYLGKDVEVITVVGGRNKAKKILELNYPIWGQILIDDKMKCLCPWIENGGIAIQHKTAKNTVDLLKRIGWTPQIELLGRTPIR